MSTNPSLSELIQLVDQHVPDPKKGLPEEVFYFVSRMTPFLNVDLLIQNDRKDVLLTWREDKYYRGWHVPGGIVRFKERITQRINAVALSELGVQVEHESNPISMLEKICTDRDVRGHFFSMLYRCHLLSQPKPEWECTDIENPKPRQWMWHSKAPVNLLPQHQDYRKFMAS